MRRTHQNQKKTNRIEIGKYRQKPRKMPSISKTRNPHSFTRYFPILLCVLPAAILFHWHASLYGDWLIDDAGISFAYAKNLATGHGFVSQPGREPIEGISNPLWTMLLSVAYWAGMAFTASAIKILSSVLIFGSFLAICASVSLLIKDATRHFIAASALLLISANPAFVIWSISGLENPLMVLLGSVLLFCCGMTITRKTDAPFPRSLALSAGLISAALALTRPDGIVYSAAFPLILTGALLKHQGFKSIVRPITAYSLALLIPLGIYLSFRFWYFGDLLPNTYYAKPGTSLGQVRELLTLQPNGTAKFAEMAIAVAPALPIAIPGAIFLSVFSTVRGKMAHNMSGIHMLTLLMVLSITSYMILPSDWMAEFRFATLAVVYFYILILVLAHQALSATAIINYRWILLFATATLLLSYSYFDFRFRAERFARNPTAPLKTVFLNFKPLETLAEKIALKQPSLLIPDLGATLMYSKFHVLDLAGLCDREMARMTYRGATPAEFSNYILSTLRPDFVQAQGWWAYKAGLEKHPDFKRSYIDLGGGNHVRRASLPAGLKESDVLQLYGELVRGTPPTWPPVKQF